MGKAKTDSIINALKENLTPIKNNGASLNIDGSDLINQRLLVLSELSKEKSKKINSLAEENAKLREILESIQRLQSRTPELPDNYSHEDVGQLNDRIDEIFGKVNTALNQLKDQSNDK